MRKLYVLFLMLLACAGVSAQNDNHKISYQAVVRNAANQLMYDTDLTVAVELANSENGPAVYAETHAVHSNANGLISLLIGDGTYVSGSWDAIHWNAAWVKATISKSGTTLAVHHLPLTAVPFALYADQVNPAALADYLTENHYLTEEVQVLSISHDTVFLTGGSFVKLPAGFSGSYNDLTNKPLKSDLCDSIQECVTGWISDSTRMVYDSLHTYYATTNALKDSLTRYVGIEKLNDTLEHYLQAGALCDSLVKCEVVQNMRDSIRTNATAIAALRDADAALSTRIQNDSANLVDFKTKVKADSTALVNRIVTDSTALHNALTDTASAIRGALGDTATAIRNSIGNGTLTIMQGTTELGSFTANQMGNSNITIPTPAEQAQSDWNENNASDPAYIQNKPNIRDSVNRVVLDSLSAANSAMNRAVDTIVRNNIHDSLDVIRTKIHTDSLALVNRIVADSNALAHRMDTLLTHVCDSVETCVKGWISDSTRMVYDSLHTYYVNTNILRDTAAAIRGDIPDVSGFATKDELRADSTVLANRIVTDSTVLANRIVTDSTALVNRIVTDSTALHNALTDTASAIRGALGDTATAICNSIGNGTLTIVQGTTELGTFTANQMGNSRITIPTPAEQAQSDWKENNASDPAYIQNKPNIRDSVNRVVLDSLSAANSAMNRAVDTIVRNNIHDSLDVIRTKILTDSLDLVNRIVTDSTALVNRIVADSNALAHRMDTLLTHVCDSVETCVKGWISDSTRMIVDSLGAYYDTTLVKKAIHDTADVLRSMMTDAANDAKITIRKNGEEVGDFTVNQAADKTINIPVPTTVAEMTDASDYVKTTKLNDTLSKYATTNALNDSLTRYVGIEKLNDTLEHYLQAGALCDSLVKCEVVQNMRDSIRTNVTAIAALRDADAALSTRIQNDSANLVDFKTKVKADSTTLANRIVTDSTALVNRIVTDSLALVNRIVTDSTALADKMHADSLILATRMDTVYKHLCDSVMACDGIQTMQTDIRNNTTNITALQNKLQSDSAALADKIHSDSLALVNRIVTDSTALADKMHADSLDLVNRIVTDSTALHKAIKDTAAAIRNDICDSATVCITKALADPTSEINHAVDTIARNNIHDTAEVLRSQMPVVNDGQLSISVNGGTAQTFTANQSGNTEVNISVPTCDDLANCDLIQDILARLDRLERQNDSLAREIDKMKPALTVTGPEKTTVCFGSSKPVTYTATFHNCSSSDYTLAWKVNGADSSNVTASKLIVNVETAGQYEVVCIATRSDNTTVSDTVTTTVTVDNNIPHFIATANNLTVILSEMVYTDTIQWDTDSVPVPFSGTTAEHTYAVADTITITATSEGGCTYVYGLRLQAMAPAVTTVSVPDETITATTAIANGTVTFDGGVPSTKRGMVFSDTNQHPVLDAEGVISVMDADTGMGSFACELKRLIPCTQYYVCAFAFNDVDTVYGEVKTFTTPSFTCGSTLTDIDGNEYATLLLGSQCWMKQNLRTTHYADGTEIPKGGLNSSSYSQPFYYEPDSNIATYGRLYNWTAAMHGSPSTSANPSKVQGVCPDGWHMPSDAEWTQLTSFVASKSENVCDNNPAYIAKALASNEGWGNWGTSSIACLPVTDPAMANNKTQFSVLPAGTWEVGSSAGYKNHGHSIFRTATEYEQVEYQAAYAREFYNEHAYVDRTAPIKEVGYSVRCVLDCAGQTYLPTVSVVRITNTGGTLSMAASVVSDGGENVTERGVCWGTASQPTITSDHAAGGSGIGEFSVTPTLAPGATYYIRAYATNSKGTAYGAEVTFVMPDLPTVTTIAATDVTASTAITGGNVTADGGASVTARGVCWSTSPNPTISDSHTTDGVGTGSFTSSITGLSSNIMYYVRAYATNAGGTSYGSQVSFTTPDELPKVTTSAVSNISGTTDITATCGGNVTDMGLDNVTARGVCWSTLPTPTISDSHTTDGNGLGSFTSNITGLTASTTYYVRAYATNSAGTAYGNQESFTVPLIDEKSCPDAPTVTDHEGNVYATVLIGTQCWMRENLRTTTSPKTGTYLVNTQHKTGGLTSSYKGSKVAHWYMNDSTTYAPMGYGLLYNWCAAMDTANSDNYMEVPTPPSNGNNTSFVITVTGNHRGICPVGWHLPSFQELNGLPKTSSSNLLASGNNTTGFTALLVGDFNGTNCENNDRTYFWSSMNLPNIDQSRPLYLTSNRVQMVFLDKNYGASVRCVRD